MAIPNYYDKFWKKMTAQSQKDKISIPTRILLDWLPVGNRFLDVGCGDGLFASLAKDKFKESHGIDISEIALEKAKARGIEVKKVDLNVEQFPYPDGYFDAVACLEVIEHILVLS
jgi:2-polyprenyl-6-hydroxyphenyl methylase/3-demethylubiquinone-9 3-methyltransferase